MAVSSGAGNHAAWITVNGQQFLIESGSVHFTATKKSSTFDVKIPLNTPGAEQAFGPSLGDNTTSVIVTTRGQTATLITGEIDDVDIDYMGEQMINISGRDASAKLHDMLSAEKWINKMPHEIITDLAGRVGLSTNVDPLAIKMQRIVQQDYTKMTDNITYASVIHKLSEFMGANWNVVGNTLNIVAGPSKGNGYPINYSRDSYGRIVTDALELRVKRNLQAGKPVRVTTKSWHHHEKKVFTGQNTIGGQGTPRDYVYHLPNLTQEHVDQHAKAKSKDHARNELELTAKLVGDPSIDPTAPINLQGTLFAQSFTIDSLEHEFGSVSEGHTMSVTAKAPAQGRS